MNVQRQRDRFDFDNIMRAEGIPRDVVVKLMRAATTLHQLAEANCNGDDWRDERGPKHYSDKVASVDGSVLCKADPDDVQRMTLTWALVTCTNCRSERVEQRVRAMLKPYPGVEPIFNGDPRGAVLKLKLPSGRTNDWGREGVCVP